MISFDLGAILSPTSTRTVVCSTIIKNIAIDIKDTDFLDVNEASVGNIFCFSPHCNFYAFTLLSILYNFILHM